MPRLDADALLELEETVKVRFETNVERILADLNRKGMLDEFLKMVGMADLISAEFDIWPRDGIIIVIGHSDVSKEVLTGVAKELNLDKNRFEFCLGYDAPKTFDFKKTQWSWKYSCILAGPMPHSGKAKEDYSSILTALESTDGYPPVVRLGTNDLKITKSSFRNTLNFLIREGRIA